MSIRIGGQALADGVLMRTNRAWSIARADGSLQTGTFRSSRFQRVPLLRVIAGIAGALAISIRRTAASGKNKVFFIVLIATSAAAWPLDSYMRSVHLPPWAEALYGPASLLALIVLLRLFAPRAIWRYHGAEHKAVAAFEQGIDLDQTDQVMRCSRIHNRCGTNLIFLISFVAVLPLPSGGLGFVIFLVAIAGIAELLGYSVRNHPDSLMTKVLVAGGRLLQRTVTTKEPSEQELTVACTALKACLQEHRRAVYGELEAPTAA